MKDLLARRNYSELELRGRLSPDYPDDQIESAIEFAREAKWLLPPEELAARVAEGLDRKRKGREFINRYLESKGLPPVQRSTDAEFEKGLDLVREMTTEDQKKMQRLLLNRGYDEETIQRVVHTVMSERTSERDR